MKRFNLFTLVCGLLAYTALAQDVAPLSNALELPKIQVIPITDTANDRQYELYMKLPEGYSENKNTQYPVLYFTDALWHVEMLSGSAEYIIEETILVGISWQKDLKGDLGALGAHASRFRDYSIKKSSNPEQQAKYNLGQASTHLDFLRNDVIAYVETNYRTDPDRRSYFGYSMSGLFGAYILVTQPETFKNYILGSPSLNGNMAHLSKLASNIDLDKHPKANVFISHGDMEKDLSTHIEAFITLLQNRNEENLSVHPIIIEGTHQTAFPMTALQGVMWLGKLEGG